MQRAKKHRLIEIEWPNFGECGPPARPTVEEFEGRIQAARDAMERLGLTHLIVYGDREHFANMAFLTGFDPRFEEAVLVISQREKPLLLVGNECEGYLTVSPLFVAGKLRYERYQPFSLLNQPRETAGWSGRFLLTKASRKTPSSGVSGGNILTIASTQMAPTPLIYLHTSSTRCGN